MKYTRANLTLIFFVLFICFFNTTWSQDEKQNTNKYSNFEALKDFIENIKHESKAKQDSLKRIETKKYLNIAKLKKNKIKIADGYFLLSKLNSRTTKGLKYADSIIQISQNLNHFRYPALGYFQKGLQLYYSSNYADAVTYYAIADEYASKYKNDFLRNRIRHGIAALKGVTGENEDALKYYKQNLNFFAKEENKIKHQEQYFKALASIANSYNKNKKYDSAIYYINKGIKESNRLKDFRQYPAFLMYYGFSKKEKKEFENPAIDSLQKGLSKINIKTKIKTAAKAYMVISEIYTGQKKHEDALIYLKKVDSMYQESPKILAIQALEANYLLRDYYKLFEEDEKLLKTLDKIITLHNIVDIEKGLDYLNSNILKKYDFPNTIKEYENLIEKLEVRNNKMLVLFFIIISVLLLIILYFLYRNRLNKKRFNNLLANQKQDTIKTKTSMPLSSKSKKALPKGLSEDLIADILDKLNAFEHSKKYTKTNYTLNSLAKELNTNSAYLSKIINQFKQVNFSNYLNGLRIDNIIEELKIDKVLRSYTINAISEEAGFNNAQSFSVAFHKKTGIYPSYFIKQLETVTT